MPDYHLAQVNIARMLAPLDTPTMAEFVANLDSINALAEGSDGFIWRLTGDGNDATSLRPFDDDMIIVNMSVWESPDHLRQYVYKSAHADVMRKRKQWFSRMDVFVAMWWIPAGYIPTVQEARQRLDHLHQHGDTAEAFTYKRLYPPPG